VETLRKCAPRSKYKKNLTPKKERPGGIDKEEEQDAATHEIPEKKP